MVQRFEYLNNTCYRNTLPVKSDFARNRKKCKLFEAKKMIQDFLDFDNLHDSLTNSLMFTPFSRRLSISAEVSFSISGATLTRMNICQVMNRENVRLIIVTSVILHKKGSDGIGPI